MDLKHLGEFALIERISKQFSAPQGVTGIGDDCAVIPQRDGQSTLISTDMLVEGTHFLKESIPPYSLGWKSAAVNLSDIAAMGGKAVGTVLALALPPELDGEWVEQFIRGYKELSDQCGAPLLGGDTTSSADRINICVTAIGECPSGEEIRRDGALPGDLVCVTGPLGDSAAGLRLILEGGSLSPDEGALVQKHYHPRPRLEEGRIIARAGASAMMDISDGIGSDLRHILERSGTGAIIDCKAIPLSGEMIKVAGRRGWDPESLAIDGGEDYELLFTIAPQAQKALTLPHFVIGRISGEPELIWEGSEDPEHHGYHHF